MGNHYDYVGYELTIGIYPEDEVPKFLQRRETICKKPQLLDKDIDSMKANASISKMSQTEQDRRKLLATIIIQSLAAAGREDIANKIMEALSDDVHTYAARIATGELAEGEWNFVSSADGQWTGKIQFTDTQ